jgi:hypothetical protein
MGVFSIAKLNRLPREERDQLYLKLVPPSIFEDFEIDPTTLLNKHGERVVQGIFPTDDNFGCIEVKYRHGDKDCIFSCQVSFEAFMNSLHLDFLIINDPFSERYNVDVDESGRDTLFGTRSRNIPEEIRAMQGGLAPGMVRKGLHLLRKSVECLEIFISELGLRTIMNRGLFYHNAISWEKCGFTYFKGLKVMEKVDKEFRPGGLLFDRLNGSTPFRRKGAEKTVRGRSWAIYDGLYADVFDEDWESPVMYKRVGKDFTVNTFPDQIY